MGSSNKIICYISAAIHVLLTIIGTTLSILTCVWYKSDSRQEFNKEHGITITPFWMYVVLAIYFVIGFFSTIPLIKGIKTERFKLFRSFFTDMLNIIIFIIIRAFVVMIRQIKADYSSADVASHFFKDLGYCVFSGIVMIPLFTMYKELAGESYLKYGLDFCMCWNKKQKATRVPNTEV